MGKRGNNNFRKGGNKRARGGGHHDGERSNVRKEDIVRQSDAIEAFFSVRCGAARRGGAFARWTEH